MARATRRSPLQALIYWSLVLGVWGLILTAGFLLVFATDLPDTSKLYDVPLSFTGQCVLAKNRIVFYGKSAGLGGLIYSRGWLPCDKDKLLNHLAALKDRLIELQFLL